ncbi:hypothetical protein GCM10022211_26270 [Sphingomonas humi]|uniref:SnoaL-like domain-containing protein n=2 Tax=Sphingomonas humi TaxID=335630 RepID=A0ABP7SE60_9SPHN
MASYAADLAKGDRGAIASRYSGNGAYSLGFGPKTRESFEAIGKRYAGPEWQKPDKFEWTDLSFEQLGQDHCLVAGGFNWTVGQRTAAMAYTAVLKRERGVLRIILEHESMLTPPRAQK